MDAICDAQHYQRVRKLDEIAKCGEGLRPELKSFYERLAKDPYSHLIVRKDGMIQSGPDPDEDIASPKTPDDGP